MDGKVVIGTELNTEQLEKDLKQAQRQLTQYEKEAERLTSSKAKIQVDLQAYEQEKQAIQEATDKSLEFVQTREQVDWVLDSEKMQLEELNQKYSKQLGQLSEIDKKIENNVAEQGVLKHKVEETTRELEKQKKIADIKNTINDVGKAMSGTISKVSKWALALFGIRTAYNFIRQAVNQLATEDEQIGYDLEYMKWVLIQNLKPVVEWIIQALYTALYLVNSITQSLFNWNLLTGKSAEDFKNMKKNTGGISGDLKEARKQLAGFDEMNVLGDNTKASGGGGIDDWTPKINPNETEENIEKVKKAILKHFFELRNTVKTMDFGDWFTKYGNWGLAVYGFNEILYALEEAFLGMTLQIGGAWDILTGIFTGDFEKIKKGFTELILGMKIEFEVFATLIKGILDVILGVILGVVSSIWEWISSTIMNIYENIESSLGDIEKVFGKTVADNLRIFIESGKASLGFANEIFESIKNIFKNIIKFFDSVFKGDWKSAWDALIKITEEIFNILVYNAKGVLSNIGSLISIFVNNMAGGIKAIINSAVKGIEDLINAPIQMFNGFVDMLRGFGVNASYVKPIKLPRLAKGGIINMPGRGVPVGGAIGGERGAEGVIPLTDNQQMELLGQSIGKYITINANITNTMNGRVISKELQKIQAENDFAYNR